MRREGSATMFDEMFITESQRGSRIRARAREIETPKIHDPRFAIRCF